MKAAEESSPNDHISISYAAANIWYHLRVVERAKRVEVSGKSDEHDDAELLGRTDTPDDQLVEIGEVSAELDRVVRRHHARTQH